MRVTDAATAVSLASQAVTATRTVLTNGNANPDRLIPGTALRSELNSVEDALRIKRRVPNFAASQPDPLRVTLCDAKISIGAKTGNCGENASVAFAWFFINGHLPIYKCQFTRGDHAFVLIGDQGGQPLAICDPWANIAWPYICWQDWKRHIWGDNVPPDSDRSIVAQLVTDPGSRIGFDLLTAGQASYDGMDLSF